MGERKITRVRKRDFQNLENRFSQKKKKTWKIGTRFFLLDTDHGVFLLVFSSIHTYYTVFMFVFCFVDILYGVMIITSNLFLSNNLFEHFYVIFINIFGEN